ncbi:ribonuclease H-like [Mustelus asterias]
MKDMPLITAEETLFVDGSRKSVGGSPWTGWAVVNDKLETVKSGRIDGGLSAQVAELVALTQALELSEGKTVNIDSDRRYAFGVIHDYRTAWGRRGFITTGGTPIKHQQRIEALLRARERPREATVIKIKAHQKEPGRDNPDWFNFNGNQAADRAAQLAREQEIIDELSTAATDRS